MLDIDGFCEFKRDEERCERTIDQYRHSIEQFIEITGGELTKQNMLAYKNFLLENRAPKTAQLRVCAMNLYCDWANRPECKVRRVKTQKQSSVQNVISVEDYRKMLDGLERDGNIEGYWTIEFLAKTGVRCSELAKLQKCCLRDGFQVLHSKGKMRKILIPDSLIERSIGYFEQKPGDYLFTSKSGKPLDNSGIYHRVRHYGKLYGIPKEVCHPHSFRHLFAKQFLAHDGNLSLLSDILGHESVATTAIYTRLSDSEQKKRIDKAVMW